MRIINVIHMKHQHIQNQDQYYIIVPQTGKSVCHSSQRTEYYKKNNNNIQYTQYTYYNILKKVRNIIDSYIHINMILQN